MLRTRILLLRNHNTILFSNILRCQSTQSNPEQATTIETYKSFTGVRTKIVGEKLPQRKPLLKNMFLGKVDKELLAFPEVISREEMAKLRDETAGVHTFFDSLDETSFDAAKSIPNEVLDNIKQLRLYGINVPEQYEGRGWQWSQTLIASEGEAGATNVACGLLTHRVVIDVLNEIGTDAQKELFLPKLADGSLLATEAIFEYNDSVDGFFNTTAKYDNDEEAWILNGEKAFVINGPSAGLFLVIAQTLKLNMAEDIGKTTTIFLVDKSTPGVKVGEQHSTIGCRGLPTSRVQFDNVKVSESCVLGSPHAGSVPAEITLRSSRLRSSLIGLALSKKILNELTQHSIRTKQSTVALKDMESIRKHISKVMTNTYAMESMIYLTAGLLDEFESQDVSIETAVTKYFTLTKVLENSFKSIDVIGPKSLLPSQSSEISLRNVLQLYTQTETLDALRMYISLSGLQHAGMALNDSVRKSRNPLFFPGHMLSKLMQATSIDNPKSKLSLGEALHPSLEAAAQCIERSIKRLEMVVELLLTKYGPEIVNKHIDIQRLTEMVAQIYAMFASTARASRAYCIGLTLADHELLLALTICSEGEAIVKTLTYEVFNGPYVNNDINVNRLTKQVFKSGGYFPEHPLAFNF